jgi:hypothetical protein
VTCQIGVHEEWLLRIIGPIEKQACSQTKRPLMLNLQVIECRHAGVEVQHLRSRTFWPGRLRQTPHLLERQAYAVAIA